MGSNGSLAAGFELGADDDGRRFITLDGTAARQSSAADWWAVFEALRLDVPGVVGDGDGVSTGDSGAANALIIAGLQHRRLRFRAATLHTDEARLGNALHRCGLDRAGITDTRIWMGPAGPRLVGRFTHEGFTAPFTIGIAFRPRSESRRRLTISFADVRIFAHLPLPAPMIGAAVARAVDNKAHEVAGALHASACAIDVDPLEQALIAALVTEGWRLPDLRHARLESVTHTRENVTLAFVNDGQAAIRAIPFEDQSPLVAFASSYIEGEPLPEASWPVEQSLMAADFAGAEKECRQALLANPADRLLRARLLALTAASGSPEAARIAAGLMDDCPDFLPGFLYGAIIARAADEGARAAALFARVAALADDRGEAEDAALARAAEAEARASVRARELEGEVEGEGGSDRDANATATQAAKGERDDLEGELARLEESLRVLPAEAPDARAQVRQRIGEIQMQLSNWVGARHAFELILAQQPGRADLLERLAQIYGHLGLHRQAVGAWDRLSRLYPNPRQRATALFREGEILREALGDEARAFDAYLKSSDLDPSYVPTALRLIAGYFSQGLFHDAAAIGEDLMRLGTMPELETSLRLRLALALAIARDDASEGANAVELHRVPWDGEIAAAALAECAQVPTPPTGASAAVIAAVVEGWRLHRVAAPSDRADQPSSDA